jgi:acrylyl-CoA reductase (NADPH)
MLCVMALEEGGVKPEHGTILVTGASGGVGSTAIALLSALGYRVAALTGRISNSAYLMALGATAVLARNEHLEMPRPLEKQRWAGAIDTLGETVLARVLAEMNYNSTLVVCGLAAGYQLSTTVMPFILRNVRLQGIDSVRCPVLRRQTAWDRLANILPSSFYQQATQEISLDAVPAAAAALINNCVTGRTLVKVR